MKHPEADPCHTCTIHKIGDMRAMAMQGVYAMASSMPTSLFNQFLFVTGAPTTPLVHFTVVLQS